MQNLLIFLSDIDKEGDNKIVDHCDSKNINRVTFSKNEVVKYIDLFNEFNQNGTGSMGENELNVFAKKISFEGLKKYNNKTDEMLREEFELLLKIQINYQKRMNGIHELNIGDIFFCISNVIKSPDNFSKFIKSGAFDLYVF